jgi:MtN3 and saliva related transmembrane protein
MLKRIPDKYFEAMGTVVGFLASLSIAAQVYAEYSSETPSTVSKVYVLGFLAIFVFWTFYGLRFKRPALWITNGIAVLAQLLLLIVILCK